MDIAIKAFNKLEWPLVIIGDGPELNRLKKIAQPNIKFLGHQTDDAVRNYYAKCSAFIMPQEEDFGLVPVEAMACGCPVVAWADNAGPSETVIEGISGYLAKPYDCGDFAEKIEQVLKEDLKERKKSEIVKSVERFKEEVQMKVFVEEIEKVKKNFI